MKLEKVCVMLVGLIQVLSVSACAQPLNEDLLRDLERDVNRQTRDVEVYGTVVTQDGQMVENVKVEYHVRRFGDVLANKAKEYKFFLSDGDFKIKENGITSLTVWFRKPGFYQHQWSYVVSEDPDNTDPDNLRELEIEVALFRKPEPAPLLRFAGVLRTDRSGHAGVLKFPQELHRGTEGGGSTGSKSTQPFEQNFIFLEGLRDAGGKLAISGNKAGWETRNRKVLDRGWIGLDQVKPGDGFVVFEPKHDHKRSELGFREMDLAPAEGYSPVIVISAEEGPSFVYFYFRSEGEYGKGMVNAKPYIEDKDGRTAALSRIVLFINPTGSRDVAYLHD